MLLRREWRTLNETGPRSFHTSNFLVLQGFFKNFWTYAMVMCPVLMPNGGPSVRSGGPSGAGLHSRLYWKVSFNLLRWSSVLCRKVPFSSLPVCSGQFFAHLALLWCFRPSLYPSALLLTLPLVQFHQIFSSCPSWSFSLYRDSFCCTCLWSQLLLSGLFILSL